MISAEAFAVALADFGQDINPIPCLHTVVGLNVQCPLWLNDLEHLKTRTTFKFDFEKSEEAGSIGTLEVPKD